MRATLVFNGLSSIVCIPSYSPQIWKNTKENKLHINCSLHKVFEKKQLQVALRTVILILFKCIKKWKTEEKGLNSIFENYKCSLCPYIIINELFTFQVLCFLNQSSQCLVIYLLCRWGTINYSLNYCLC